MDQKNYREYPREFKIEALELLKPGDKNASQTLSGFGGKRRFA